MPILSQITRSEQPSSRFHGMVQAISHKEFNIKDLLYNSILDELARSLEDKADEQDSDDEQPPAVYPSSLPQDDVAQSSHTGSKRPRSPSPSPSLPDTSSVTSSQDVISSVNITSSQSKLNYGHKLRKLKREQAKNVMGHVPNVKLIERRIDRVQKGHTIKTELISNKLPVTKGAFIATNSKGHDKKEYTPGDLDALGFEKIEWNGRDLVLISDAMDHVIGVCVGSPATNDWDGVCRRAFQLIEKEGTQNLANFKNKELNHRRGVYPIVNLGITNGMGLNKVVNVDLHKHEDMVSRILADSDIQRMANHASMAFNTYAPKIANYYNKILHSLLDHNKNLKKPFPRSTYSNATINFGPKVFTSKHRDSLNLPFGMCAIQSLGTFDHRKGGHLTLWDVKLYIEFPPGTLILIPSATLEHSNTKIMEYESRASLTQYSGGGLFRYIENGYMTNATLKATDPDKFKEMVERSKERWEFGLNLFSKQDELLSKS